MARIRKNGSLKTGSKLHGATSSFKGNTKSVTKSRAKWKPGNRFDIRGLAPGFRYRLVSRQKISENGGYDWRGWQIVAGFNRSGEHVPHSGDKRDDTHSLTSTSIVGDLVLARMPEEKAITRDEYYNEKTETRIRSMQEDDKRKWSQGRGKYVREVENEYTDEDDPNRPD